MRDRVRGLSRRAGEGALVATFHSFGLWFLRQEHKLAGLPKWFSICDSGDQASVLKRCMKDVQVDSRRFDVRHLLGILSRRKSEAAVPDVRGAARDDEYEAFADEILPRYEQALRAQRSLDFEDLIVRPVTLLAEDQSLRATYRERFRHVLVDEYQDTNRVQLRLLELLSGPEGGGSRRRRAALASEWSGRSLCAVGDDDQSIYGWRGAEVKNILRFETHFPGAQVIRLEQNYRSTGNILGCANGVIARAAERRPKRLWTETGAGDPVRVVPLPTEEEEARFVAGEVARGMSDGRSASDFAVLYRLNAQSQPIEEALREVGIQHKVKGGPAFFDRAEVRDVLAWLESARFPTTTWPWRAWSTPRPGASGTSRWRDWATGRRRNRGPLEVRSRSRGRCRTFRAAPRRSSPSSRPSSRTFVVGSVPAGWSSRRERCSRNRPPGLASPERPFAGGGHPQGRGRGCGAAIPGEHERRDPKAIPRDLPAAACARLPGRRAGRSRGSHPVDPPRGQGSGIPGRVPRRVRGGPAPRRRDPGRGPRPRGRAETRLRRDHAGSGVLWLTRAAARTRRGRIEPGRRAAFSRTCRRRPHVRHDPSAANAASATSARSAEVLQALRSRLGARR